MKSIVRLLRCLILKCEAAFMVTELYVIFSVRIFQVAFFLLFQEPIKSRAPQLHLEYRFYKQLGSACK